VARGVVAEATPGGHDASSLNDSGLAAKVESELFRPAGAPKGSVDVNVEDGIAVLRGEVADRGQLDDLLSRARSIDGVVSVKNLLHVAGDGPPRSA
jgi:osmotically-inducible protein OsmY